MRRPHWICLAALSACGQVAREPDASVADAAPDVTCAFCFDAGFEGPEPPPPPPPIDAGVLDGSTVRCGSVSCSAPAQYCCITATPLADAALDLSFACADASAPTWCAASIYCDDPSDCAPGTDCCWDRYDTSHSSCVPSGTCKCPLVPNCDQHVMCLVDASTCTCKPDALVPEYGICW